MQRLLAEYGLGTSLRRADYTEAAIRALKNALWTNSINAAELMGFEKADMLLEVQIGVQKPDEVDVAQVAAVFPYGSPYIRVTKGGLDVPRPDGDGNPTVMASAAIAVGFAMERKS